MSKYNSTIGCRGCKSAELASRYKKIIRREPVKDGKILSDNRQDGYVEAYRL